jgi:hypothetical protein
MDANILPLPVPAVEKREHFIPVRKADLIRLLADDDSLSEQERSQFLDLCRMLEATFHFEYHDELEKLKDAYAAFDPDRDTVVNDQLRAYSNDGDAATLFQHMVTLLERANFRHLDQEEIEAALNDTTDWGVRLDVDFGVFERLEVYSRGEVTTKRTCRNFRTLFKKQEVEVPIYQRLVIIFRLKDHERLAANANLDAVTLKIFKNIPRVDLEMLFPGTKVCMTLLDRAKILLPTISGVAVTVGKIINNAVGMLASGMSGVLAFLGLVGGTVGYGVKSFFGYLRAKDKYQLNLTKNLYYQNLDNNAGVLFRLLDEVEEQEFREAILAYEILRREAPSGGWTQDELDRRVEAFLLEQAGVDIDFEVDDALAKLKRLGLTLETPTGRYLAIQLPEALARLDRAWDAFFEFPSGDSEVAAAA